MQVEELIDREEIRTLTARWTDAVLRYSPAAVDRRCGLEH